MKYETRYVHRVSPFYQEKFLLLHIYKWLSCKPLRLPVAHDSTHTHSTGNIHVTLATSKVSNIDIKFYWSNTHSYVEQRRGHQSTYKCDHLPLGLYAHPLCHPVRPLFPWQLMIKQQEDYAEAHTIQSGKEFG